MQMKQFYLNNLESPFRKEYQLLKTIYFLPDGGKELKHNLENIGKQYYKATITVVDVEGQAIENAEIKHIYNGNKIDFNPPAITDEDGCLEILKLAFKKAVRISIEKGGFDSIESEIIKPK